MDAGFHQEPELPYNVALEVVIGVCVCKAFTHAHSYVFCEYSIGICYQSSAPNRRVMLVVSTSESPTIRSPLVVSQMLS